MDLELGKAKEPADQPPLQPTTNHHRTDNSNTNALLFASYLYFHDSFNLFFEFSYLWDHCQGAWDLLKNPEKRSAYDASTGT